MSSIPGFAPSTHGLHFTNSWPAGTPDFHVPIPPFGSIPIGDASNGLCGGMVFTAADLYLAGRRPPATTTAPAGGTPLFDYIASRLLASFDIPGGIATYYYWANTPDHDTGIWPFIRAGLARMTIHDQIPQITAAIDSGRPAALGLVTVRSMNPGDLGRCHQVLAYRYDWDGAYLRLGVYDPNRPNVDDVMIGLDTSNPAHTTTIDSTVACGSIRGFFFTRYAPVDPSAIAAQAADPLAARGRTPAPEPVG